MDAMNSLQMTALCKAYHTFIINQSENPTLTFWSSYIEMVECLLLFLRATREGNLSLHPSSLVSILPCFFSCDNVNYARYGTAYIMEMFNLPSSHPLVYSKFSEGQFVIQGFSQVAYDMAIEQTFNRESNIRAGMR